MKRARRSVARWTLVYIMLGLWLNATLFALIRDGVEMPPDLFAALAAAIVAMIASGVAALRRLARAGSYVDRARYRSGTRAADGVVTFDDGSPPVMAPGRPGPVTVHVANAIDGTYRLAPRTIVVGVMEGDLETLSRETVALAARVLSYPCWVFLCLVGCFCAWAACVVIAFWLGKGVLEFSQWFWVTG